MTRHVSSPFAWVRVRMRMLCNRCERELPAGTWMRSRRGDHRGMHSCQWCLAEQGIPCPDGLFTFKKDESVDVRARQAGTDE